MDILVAGASYAVYVFFPSVHALLCSFGYFWVLADPFFFLWLWHFEISCLRLSVVARLLLITNHWPSFSLNFFPLLVVSATGAVLFSNCHSVGHLPDISSYYVTVQSLTKMLMFVMFMRKTHAGLGDVLDSATIIGDFKSVRRPVMMCFAFQQTCVSYILSNRILKVACRLECAPR